MNLREPHDLQLLCIHTNLHIYFMVTATVARVLRSSVPGFVWFPGARVGNAHVDDNARFSMWTDCSDDARKAEDETLSAQAHVVFSHRFDLFMVAVQGLGPSVGFRG